MATLRVMIGIHKHAFLQSLLMDLQVPPELKGDLSYCSETYSFEHSSLPITYWVVGGFDWDAFSFAWGKALIFFKELDQMPLVDIPDKGPSKLFGALRLGTSDGDIEEWGTPYAYDIHLRKVLDLPEIWGDT